MTHAKDLFTKRLENILRTGENNGYWHFLLFLPCFQRPYSHFLQQESLAKAYLGFYDKEKRALQTLWKKKSIKP